MTGRPAADAVLESVVATAPEGFALFDTDLRFVRVNAAMAAIHGVPAEDHIGRTAAGVVPDAGHDAPLREVLLRGEAIVDLELTGHAADDAGRERTWLASYHPVRGADGAISWLAAFVVDITARKREEERTRVLARLGGILNEVSGPEERLRRLVDAVVPALADRCSAALLRVDGRLEPVAERAADGVPPDSELASSITVPLVVHGRTLGELALGSRQPGAFDDDGAFARDLAGRAALAIDNTRLIELERQARDWTERQYAVAAALADAMTPADVASAVLSEIVDAVGAEHGTVWQLCEDGTTLVLIGARGFGDAELADHRRVRLREPRPVADAIRTRSVVRFGTAAEADAAYPIFEGGLSARGLESSLAVPLPAAGRAVGGLFLSAARTHAFGPDERALAAALAAQAGQALERARLFEAERDISVTLQRSLLPAGLPEIDGVELAVRYMPAAGLQAGGDFYEVLPLPDGTVGVAVGDVVGRGATAAAAMGQLRSALRAFALTGEGPAGVLRHLSAFGDTVGGAMAATAVVGRLDPRTGELRYACAGHPWPLLAHANGEAEFLTAGRGVPLACVTAPDFTEATARLEPGSTLLLYTDGLTERRGLDTDAVLERLRRAAAEGAQRPLADLLDLAVARTGDAPPADDVALVAVRRRL